MRRGKLIGMITYIIVGLVAGAIAKALLPGRIGGGWLSTLVLGLVGALVGGIIAAVVFHTGAYSLLPRIGWATTGAGVGRAVNEAVVTALLGTVFSRRLVPTITGTLLSALFVGFQI